MSSKELGVLPITAGLVAFTPMPLVIDQPPAITLKIESLGFKTASQQLEDFATGI